MNEGTTKEEIEAMNRDFTRLNLNMLPKPDQINEED